MSKNTGGPAFPVPGYKFVDDQHFTKYAKALPGMTLRDYFAAKAIQASLPDPAYSTWDAERHARRAYSVADAMIAARGIE